MDKVESLTVTDGYRTAVMMKEIYLLHASNKNLALCDVNFCDVQV
jgi:hypothetical protein